MKKPKCECCGTTKNVTFAPDPYQEDVNNDHTPVNLCGDCRDRASDDI